MDSRAARRCGPGARRGRRRDRGFARGGAGLRAERDQLQLLRALLDCAVGPLESLGCLADHDCAGGERQQPRDERGLVHREPRRRRSRDRARRYREPAEAAGPHAHLHQRSELHPAVLFLGGLDLHGGQRTGPDLKVKVIPSAIGERRRSGAGEQSLQLVQQSVASRIRLVPV